MGTAWRHGVAEERKIRSNEMHNTLKSTDVGKTPGIEGIFIEMLKHGEVVVE